MDENVFGKRHDTQSGPSFSNYLVLPVNTTTFKTHQDSKGYTGPLGILLTAVNANCVARNCLDNGMVGLGHLRHDGLVFLTYCRSVVLVVDWICCLGLFVVSTRLLQVIIGQPLQTQTLSLCLVVNAFEKSFAMATVFWYFFKIAVKNGVFVLFVANCPSASISDYCDD